MSDDLNGLVLTANTMVCELQEIATMFVKTTICMGILKTIDNKNCKYLGEHKNGEIKCYFLFYYWGFIRGLCKHRNGKYYQRHRCGYNDGINPDGICLGKDCE